MNIIEKFRTRVSKYGMKYVMQVILRNKIQRPLDKLVMTIAKMLWSNTALKDTIVIESHNDFDTNGGAFYDYLIANGYNHKYKIIWMIKNKKPSYLPLNVRCFNIFAPSFRKAYNICTAKILTCDDVIIEKVNDRQKMFYLSHGAVSLKRPKGFMDLPKCLDFCLAPSDFIAPIQADIFNLGYPNKKQIVLGYPVHDILYTNSTNEIKKVSGDEFRKVILWMPTFRKSKDFNRNDSEIELAMGIPLVKDLKEYEALNNILNKSNTLLIIKIHPMQDMTTVKIKDMSNIKVLDGVSIKELKINNYRLMKDTDALISDYSSVAYDYLHLNKPIAYTMDDVGTYKMKFIVDDPQTLIAGPVIYTFDDLKDFIVDVLNDRDKYQAERKEVFAKVFKYHDGKSSQRLVEFMKL